MSVAFTLAQTGVPSRRARSAAASGVISAMRAGQSGPARRTRRRLPRAVISVTVQA